MTRVQANSLSIKRATEGGYTHAIVQKVADIPGGVSVDVSDLGGDVLFESTPLTKPDSETGLAKVVKTAKVVTKVTASAKKIEVAKGHHFNIGDVIGTADNGGQTITAIDKTATDKDTLTVGTALGEIEAGTTLIQVAEAGSKELLRKPFCLAGSDYPIATGVNRWVDAEVISVVNSAIAQPVNDSIKAELKGIIYY